MRFLNLLITILMARRPSTERPISPDLVKNVVCIISLAVLAGVLGSALLLGAHIGLFFILTYYGIEFFNALLIVAGIGVICFAIVVGDLVYRIKHLFAKNTLGPTEPNILTQLSNVPESFLEGFFSKDFRR